MTAKSKMLVNTKFGAENEESAKADNNRT